MLSCRSEIRVPISVNKFAFVVETSSASESEDLIFGPSEDASLAATLIASRQLTASDEAPRLGYYLRRQS